MECKAVTNLLIDYLEHHLTPLEQMEMQAHFRSCPECEQFLRAYNSTITLIQNLRQEKVQIPEPVRLRLQEFLRKHRALQPAPGQR
ncbi:MAG: zf-HC2 domain-containing protein [Acidobacteria bacterium]|nr:zf-HC2 domain-containing protein [Acidobacteriota bacterium]